MTSLTARCTSTTIYSLPTEVTELVLIFTAAGGFPTAIAAFSQTCRVFRSVVHNTADQHLWREVFLTTFDDPRDTGNDPVPGYQTSPERPTEKKAKEKGDADKPFDWGVEFRRRIWTANYIRHSTKPKPEESASSPDPAPAATESMRDIVALDSLLSIVHSARPCPPTIVFSFPSPPDIKPRPGVDVGSSFTAQPAYPIFPPEPHTLCAQLRSSAESTPGSGPAPTHLPTSVGCATSLNIPWFESVIAHGLPPPLTALISGPDWPGGLAGHLRTPHAARTMQALGQLVAYTGFIPVPDAGAPAHPDGACPARALDMGAAAQHRRARRLARMRVYNMRYLSAVRRWGPFRVADDAGAGAPLADQVLLEPLLALFADPHEEDADVDAAAAGSPQLVAVAGRYATDSDGAEDADTDTDTDTDADTGSEGEQGAAPPPAGALRPDWAYLAAARVVVEANLREAVGAEELSGLVWLDGLRRGSAPVDTGASAGGGADLGRVWGEPASEDDGWKGQEIDHARSRADAVDGWDWAGVTGVWRRCLCWMDYRDLILQNLSSEFNDPHLQEAVRIVPMRVRAAWYSPSPVPAYSDRPTIHVEGETSGAGPGVRTRKVRGTVSVVADGSIRWNLYTAVEGGDTDEWATEGIQVGGPTSAMGVLGIWTGAQHERMDPLGPFWAWKVG